MDGQGLEVEDVCMEGLTEFLYQYLAIRCPDSLTNIIRLAK